jgi:hypothetical protein
MSGRDGRSTSCGRHLPRKSVHKGRQPALTDLLPLVGTQRHRAVHNRRASSGSLVELTRMVIDNISVFGLPFLLEGNR